MLHIGIDSMDTEDGTFDAVDFFDQLMELFEDDEEWVQDTLNWWNERVFGISQSSSRRNADFNDDGESTAATLAQ